VFQYRNREKGVRAQWPGETQKEWIKAGSGRDVKAWLMEELATPAAIAVIQEGNIPVHLNLWDNERCKYMEFLIFPLGRLPEIVSVDWKRLSFMTVKEPKYAQRRSYHLWQKERNERALRCDEWFNRWESRDCEIFWKEMEMIACKADVEWMKGQLKRLEPEDIRTDDMIERMHQEISKEIKPKASSH
jgi:hypothetical protein